MKQISIIGSGQAGLLTAHGLLQAGYQVTLYSDKTAQGWLDEARPTGTAARFKDAMDYERALGLNLWEGKVPNFGPIELTLCEEVGNPLLKLNGLLTPEGQAIDLRLQSAAWLDEFEARGGELIIEKVNVPRLDEIAAQSDLTLVAVGRGALAYLFPRNAQRSVYDKPQRNLAMVVTTGATMPVSETGQTIVKFNIIDGIGEAYWTPYYHKTLGKSWNLVFEAKPGGPLDIFDKAHDGYEAVELAKKAIRTFMPWDWAWAKDMKLADENGWLTGRIAPTVREPVGTLPSGRVVMPIGDASMSFDPLAGQGANNGSRMARHVVEAVVAHGDSPFTAEWMTETFEAFYAEYGKVTYDFTNTLLEPMTPAGKQLLIAQIGSTGRTTDKSSQQQLANTFISNFRDPRTLTATLHDVPAMRALISEKTGRHWLWSLLRGGFTIAKGQIQHKLGLRKTASVPSRPTVHLTPSRVGS